MTVRLDRGAPELLLRGGLPARPAPARMDGENATHWVAARDEALERQTEPSKVSLLLVEKLGRRLTP